MLLLLLFLQEEASAAWVVPQQRPSHDFGSRTQGFATSDTRLYLESISLDCLGEDHEAVGSEIASSVQRWLDAEWMTQDVHLQMGKSCQRTYVSCRESGKEDLTDIMLQVADDLMENWDAYDKDAFVNAYGTFVSLRKNNNNIVISACY